VAILRGRKAELVNASCSRRVLVVVLAPLLTVILISAISASRNPHEAVVHAARVNVVSGDSIGWVVKFRDGALTAACARA
jgi:hypothetical protein